MNNNGIKPSSGYRFTLLDGGLLLGIASLIGWLYYRSEVGIHYHWHWREAWTLIFTPRADGSLPYFLQGLGATLRLSLWGMVLALVLGSLIGIARSRKAWFVRLPANAFVQLVRNIPPLVFVFIFYFFISNQLIPLLGLDELLRYHTAEVHPLITLLFGPARLWENLLSGVLCIGLLSSAHIAEIVRAGLANIPQGQWEAADSLGLPTWVKYRYVIAPQVLTAITPALAGQTISLIKDTSIISLISIQELTFVGSEIANSSGLIFEIWLIVGAAYLVLCLTLSMLFKQVEKRSLRHLSR
ncbi:polar amino acid transport system permease protein [Vibrio mimicus]|uniref:amino acid ABC transporter permease n=1 Tax=Vibrio mimicus TaxID=674 RepID=UPI0002B9760D|nr:amino acid ABC transporter permease [Vibrio mimicus]EMB51898.1 amino acid ABC transporter, permease protein [Vibrio mimicus CAIM 602]MBY7675638.1 amino acid ABC transporter permease [Vibrio mimicus]MBY7727475.1 amino acid ABC transporter permease [Vibrio mimicus]TXY30988.1 amino acid ABC transporter permease [Vibrio mimicus]SUQ23070.1 polar amino acid transport system permease protein [Vibrio mimicus]